MPKDSSAQSVRTAVLAIAGAIACLPWHAVAAEGRDFDSLSIDVAPVWAGHPVGFAITTAGDFQYVGFYDPRRRMTIAQRRLPSTRWVFATLPTSVGWDSHNGIALEVDRKGHVHVSGNMHSARLIYFRSARPHDISTFERPGMVGSLEKKVTYPQFLTANDGTLFFEYRHGKSGSGARIVNRYDADSRIWTRLMSAPLFDGLGEKSAYLSGPVFGPDGAFHLVWMWRDTPYANTNHDVSYARSRDLEHWETVAGERLELPLTPRTMAAIVDPVPTDHGLVGGGFGVGWDARLRPVISYLKYGPDGFTQSFNTRWEKGAWIIRQTSSWKYRWNLERTGTLPWNVVANPVTVDFQKRLTQSFDHLEAGRGVWILDEETLRPVARLDEPTFFQRLRQVTSTFPGMEVRPLIFDRQGEYVLRWETLPINRDRPRKPPYPPPSMLRVYSVPFHQEGPEQRPEASGASTLNPD